jgi:CheY-like chemotaxis protein
MAVNPFVLRSMDQTVYPFAARLIGFSPAETATIATHFRIARETGQGQAYFCLSPDSLQDPDLFLVNGRDVRALAVLADLNASDARPALLIGAPEIALPYPTVPLPIAGDALFGELDKVIARRADALARLATLAAAPVVVERRRKERVDMDLTDPAEYAAMRKAPKRGGVLVVDRNAGLRDHIEKLLAQFKVPVAFTADAGAAVNHCFRNPTSVVLINTSMAEFDPYRLCAAIKKSPNPAVTTAVVFLNGATFTHDSKRAHEAGFDGLLDKPVAQQHLMAALRKFLHIG